MFKKKKKEWKKKEKKAWEIEYFKKENDVDGNENNDRKEAVSNFSERNKV